MNWSPERNKPKPSDSIVLILSLLIVNIVIDVANFLIWRFVTKEFSFPIQMQTVIISPLLLMVYPIIIIIRHALICRKQLKIRTPPSFNTTINRQSCSYGTTDTHFNLPEDEWDIN